MSTCNNFSLADDKEVLDAYDLVMSLASQEIECEMLKLVDCLYSDQAKVARTICHQNPVIFNLVNKQLEETQTAERQKVRTSKKENFMIPQYSASITCLLGTTLKVYFSHAVTPELYNALYSLGEYAGIQVNGKGNDELCIILRPVWAMETVVEEVVSILLFEGFERDSILVK